VPGVSWEKKKRGKKKLTTDDACHRDARNSSTFLTAGEKRDYCQRDFTRGKEKEGHLPALPKNRTSVKSAITLLWHSA